MYTQAHSVVISKDVMMPVFLQYH